MTSWPAHTYRSTPWSTHPEARDRSGRRAPIEDRLLTEITVSIPPHIAGLNLELDAATTTAVREAARAIIALDAQAETTLGALSGFLLRSESVATSKIEHISADLDDFARALAGREAGVQARQTADAVQAITSLVDNAATPTGITIAVLDDTQRRFVAHDPAESLHAGAARTVQNWIGGSDFSPRNAVHVPPPADLVPALLRDLVSYLDQTGPDPLVQAALAHAQFETIHPYTDGNGRVGRALINGVFRQRKLTAHVVVPVASAMLAQVDRYFALLNGYRSGDALPFVRFLADSARYAAEEARTSAAVLSALPEQWRAATRPRRGSAADQLISGLLSAPILTEATASAITGKAKNRVYIALGQLEDSEVLTEITGKARNRAWVAGDVLDEVDRLEQRIGQRAVPTI